MGQLTRKDAFELKKFATADLAADYVFNKTVSEALLGELAGKTDYKADTDPSTGKPVFLSEPGFYANLSHSYGNLLLGVSSRSDIGVDIESAISTKTAASAAPIFLSSREVQLLSQGGPSYAGTALRFWTLKEAAAKLSGLGIREDFRKLDFASVPPESRSFRQVNGFWVATPRLGAGVYAAVAVGAKPSGISLCVLSLRSCCLKKMRGNRMPHPGR